jgi:hypothetical protein
VGKKLDNDENTLEDYSIEDDTTLMLAMIVKLGCFSPSSLITVEGGKSVKVDELKRGDSVLSFNEKTKLMEIDEITSVHKTMLSSYLVISL